MNAPELDQLIADEILRVVEPEAIEASMRAVCDLRAERERLSENWRQNMERAKYEAAKAERSYRAVDPENRLVARTLEQQWESALRKEQALSEEFERFKTAAPISLTEAEVGRLRALAENLRSVWDAPSTSAIDRLEVARCLIASVAAHSPDDVLVEIKWQGGDTTTHQFRRAVCSYQRLKHGEETYATIRAGRKAGRTNTQIADELNQKGLRPPADRSPEFTRPLVAQVACRLGLAAPQRADLLSENEWWLREFAEMPFTGDVVLEVSTSSGRTNPNLHG